MYALLLTLGAVITAAGLVLIASGLSVHQHAFDPTNVTPSAIAIVGGCILIGLAFVVRALTRVERALMMRSLPHPPVVQDARTDAVAPAPASEAGPISFPFKPKATLQPSAAATEAPAPLESATQGLPAPTSERIENVALGEGSKPPPPAASSARPDENTSEAKHTAAARTNGSAQPKAAPEVAMGGRSARQSQPQAKSATFDALWPKTQHAVSEIHAATAAQPVSAEAAPQSAGQDAPNPSARPATTAQQSGPAVSILKSGVVEGMAYTLYSDGSIEATLPSGTLRFNSITDLRNHIEHSG